MSEFGVYYDNPSGILPVSNLHQGLTDEITYKDDAKLFDNIIICQVVTWPVICLLSFLAYGELKISPKKNVEEKKREMQTIDYTASEDQKSVDKNNNEGNKEDK